MNQHDIDYYIADFPLFSLSTMTKCASSAARSRKRYSVADYCTLRETEPYAMVYGTGGALVYAEMTGQTFVMRNPIPGIAHKIEDVLTIYYNAGKA